MTKANFFNQGDYTARFEWGYEGVQHVGPGSSIVVIIDVLSFSTCVDVVVGRGGIVFPYRMKDESAGIFAEEKKAILAGKRGEPISLSPACLRTIPQNSRIVLPSPNGSTCTVLAKECDAMVIAACLRNASAVASFIRQQKGTVTIIACGERWSNGALRPAIEDMVAAGAILHELKGHRLSVEAQIAVAAFLSAKRELSSILEQSGSGQELIRKGYPEDVYIAAQYNVSQNVPILNDECAYEAVVVNGA
ncbi:2-phosphosulfolactate phosphatase [Brevibacillus sp. NRS-1366]|uniref:2-phosphosulfolactate phosphatase n=1 Tax=Brevibacillus sp. NRS-1366 TaxID=3233899 RepID=UPI003D2173BD